MRRTAHILVMVLSLLAVSHVEGQEDWIDIRTTISGYRNTGNGDSIPVVVGASYIFKQGAPELSKFVESYDLAALAPLEYEILLDSFLDVKASIAPSTGFVYQNQSVLDRTPGPEYAENIFYPDQLVKAFDPVQIRDKYRQSLWIHPMQYNPVSQVLRIHTHIRIRLKKPDLPKKVKGVDGYTSSSSMLILIPDSMVNALLPLVQWKKQLGIQIYLHRLDRYLNPAQIKAVLTDWYTQKQMDYVMLVGDHEQIPAYSSIYGPSDYSYSLLVGGDHYGDVSVGRFPAKTTQQLSSMIAKTVAFEQALNGSAETPAFGAVASRENGNNSGDKGESDLEHTILLARLFEENGYQARIVSEADPDRPAISSLFNAGSDYLFYTGHGNETAWSSVSFNVDSVGTLQNNGRFPVILDAACLNGNFTHPTCLAEKFMRVSNEKGPIGSVAMLASTITQLWAPPMLGQDVIAEQLFTAKDTTVVILGKVCQRSYEEIIAVYGSGGTETAYTWALFGDPSLSLWNQSPAVIHVTAPTVYDLSQDTFRVQAPEGALVTLVSDTNLLASALVVNGEAVLIPGVQENLEQVTLTVTKAQHTPFVSVMPPYHGAGSYYTLSHFLLADDNNNQLENGEWMELLPTFKNHGTAVGEAVEVSIIACDTAFTVETGTITLDSIGAGAEVAVHGFRVRTKDEVPDGYDGTVCFRIADKSGQANQKCISLRVHAPLVQLTSIAVNGDWSPVQSVVETDTVTISAVLYNKGHADGVSQLMFKLESIFVQYLEDPKKSAFLAARSQDTIHFKLLLSKNCAAGTKLVGELLLMHEPATRKEYAFYYLTQPNIMLEGGQFVVDDYPFYNYYKANRTQMLYAANDLSHLQMIVDSIGFHLAGTTNNASLRTFNNFSIKLMEIDCTMIDLVFLETTSAVTVYHKTKQTLPGEKGWIYFDIDDFTYSGSRALLVEITWGINDMPASYSDVFSVYAHQHSRSSVVYGYSDYAAIPGRRGSSRLRPDILFCGKLQEQYKVYLSIDKNRFAAGDDTLHVKIGEKMIAFTQGDTIQLELPPACYAFTLLDGSSFIVDSGSFTVTGQDAYLVLLSQEVVDISTSHSEKKCLAYISGGRLYVELPEKALPAQLILYDFAGRKVLTEIIHDVAFATTLPVAAGVYVLDLWSHSHALVRGWKVAVNK